MSTKQLLQVLVVAFLLALVACGGESPAELEEDALGQVNEAPTTVMESVVQFGELQKTAGFTHGEEIRETYRVHNCDNPVGRSDVLTEAKKIDRSISWSIGGEVGANAELDAIIAGAGVEASIASSYALDVSEELSRGRELELPVNPYSSAEYVIVWKPIVWSGFIPFSFQSGEGRIEYIYQQVAFGEVDKFNDRTQEVCGETPTTPSPVLPTATESTTAAATSVPSTVSATSAPTASPTVTSSPTATVSPTKVSGDVPGIPLALGSTINSVIDKDTKPRDVYAIDLNAGQTLRIDLESEVGASIRLYLPEIQTIEGEDAALSCNTFNHVCNSTFNAAVSGTYYLEVYTNNNGSAYTLEIGALGTEIGESTDDVPGTSLVLGATVNSVIDKDTKPRDVYAIDLNAGQTLRIDLESEVGAGIRLYLPGIQTIEDEDAALHCTTFNFVCNSTFNAAVSGIYYLEVYTNDNGSAYTLKIDALGTEIGETTDDVPGIPLALGATVNSVIDKDTKPRDVYAIDLNAGQTLRIDLESEVGAGIILYLPGIQTIEDEDAALHCTTFNFVCNSTFNAAVSGIYYLEVYTNNNGSAYTLAVR